MKRPMCWMRTAFSIDRYLGTLTFLPSLGIVAVVLSSELCNFSTFMTLNSFIIDNDLNAHIVMAPPRNYGHIAQFEEKAQDCT